MNVFNKTVIVGDIFDDLSTDPNIDQSIEPPDHLSSGGVKTVT